MAAYLVRRLWQAIPVLIGVNLITFWLFFKVNTPDDIDSVYQVYDEEFYQPSRRSYHRQQNEA